MKNIFYLLIILSSCQFQKKEIETPIKEAIIQEENKIIEEENEEIKSLGKFPRTEIQERLKIKIKNKEDLFVHVFVPLCDNEHQGIVPVSKSLGDGFNPRTNLYWGALYGVKTHFKKQKDWKLISETKINKGTKLEQVIFLKKSNGQNIYLIADAYRGDMMKECLIDFMNSISGKEKNNITLEDKLIGTNGNADLLIFNGHNGLMDVNINNNNNKDGIKKDVIAIACRSHPFFTEKLKSNGGFPLLMTTNLLAPEAYVLEAVINEWAKGSEGKLIADATGRAYNQYQKCGYKGARRLFKSGW